MYRVRRACTEMIPEMSRAVSAECRAHVFLDIFPQLMTDRNKTVRSGALHHLGSFIATLESAQVRSLPAHVTPHCRS